MTGKVISIVNRKGGVGKTTLALALADTLVGETELPYDPANNLVLVVDLDPQASLTRALLYDRASPSEGARLRTVLDRNATIASLLETRISRTKKPASEFLTHGVGPSGFEYTLMANEAKAWDVERRGLKRPGESELKSTVGKILAELARTYQYIIVDSPPGQTVLAEAAIQNSDLVLCPTVPDLLSFWGLQSFDAYMGKLFADRSVKPPARFVFTKTKRRPPRYDPQNRVRELVGQFQAPANYVTLLKETGSDSAISADAISVPHDPRLISRLEGSPRPGRLWPWARIYTRDTQIALRRLASAVIKELNGSGSSGTHASD